MEFEDFKIEIQQDAAGGHSVRILDSPAGEARSPSSLGYQWARQISQSMGERLPQEAPEPRLIGCLIKEMEYAVRRSGSRSKQGERDVIGKNAPASGLSPQAIGEDLFSSLFSGNVLELYNKSLGIVQSQPGRGLRIRIHLALSERGAPQISCLPWEFLYRPQTNEFLSLGRTTSVVRYLEVPQPVESLPTTPPLRILAAIASPRGSSPLNLVLEREKLNRVMAEYAEIEMIFLERATLSAITKALSSKPFHIFHFMGHGSFEETREEGCLLFEDSTGGPELVNGKSLATILSRSDSLRLAFLNACDTAKTTRSDGLDPFAGVAAALMLGGLPAVLAMQFRISDEAAITFSSAFYGQLATSMPVDQATTEARVDLFSSNPKSFEWGTPVLYMRSRNGKLFDLSRNSLGEKQEALRLIASTYDDQLTIFERILLGQGSGWSPCSRESNLHDRIHRLIDLAALRSPVEWLEVTESLLAIRSPLNLFEGTLSSWEEVPPDGKWQVESGDVLGQGEDKPIPQPTLNSDIASRSLLLWRGLRFRDGALSARLWWSELGGAGLVLSYSDSGALLGLLRCLSEGLLVAQIWRLSRSRSLLLTSEPLPEVSSDGMWSISFSLAESRATLTVGNFALNGEVDIEIAAGYTGLAKLGGASVRASDIKLTVNGRKMLVP
jgi:hypothetical protein